MKQPASTLDNDAKLLEQLVKNPSVRRCFNCMTELSISASGTRRYCSETCRRSRTPRREPPSSVTVGAISELVVAVDLMKRGFSVFRALSASCPCDLVILDGAKAIRVEVRSGTRGPSGKVSCAFHKGEESRHDILAIVLRGSEVVYRPDLPAEIT